MTRNARTQAAQPTTTTKLTNAQLREIASLVAEILRTDLRAVQTMQARAAGKVAEPAPAPIARKPEPRKPETQHAPIVRKPVQAPRKPAPEQHDPSNEPENARGFGLLSERFARQLGQAASRAWADIGGLNWEWTSEPGPNVIKLALVGDHAERAASWAARWLEVQPEVRGFEYVGKVATPKGAPYRFELRIGLRSSVDVAWEG